MFGGDNMKQLLEILKADFELEELGAGEFSKIKVKKVKKQ